MKGNWATKEIWLDGKALNPNRSLKAINHSPDGFNWSYGGSGPAQLAATIMLELTGKIDNYQEFKWDVIAKLLPSNFETEFEL